MRDVDPRAADQRDPHPIDAGKPFTLRTGGFSMLPAHHVHEFHATTACTLYIYSDAPFDIHYVNAEGNEISFDDAAHAKKH